MIEDNQRYKQNKIKVERYCMKIKRIGKNH